MFWYGVLIGFCIGACLATLAYSSLVPRVEALQEFATTHERIVAELQNELEKRSAEIRDLETDMAMLMKWVPRDVVQFLDAPYRRN